MIFSEIPFKKGIDNIIYILLYRYFNNVYYVHHHIYLHVAVKDLNMVYGLLY